MNERDTIIYAMGVLDGLQAAKPKLELGNVSSRLWDGLTIQDEIDKPK